MANTTFVSRVFFDNLAENLVVQGEIGVHLLELGVFFFEFLQFLKLANLETAVLPFPLIERCSGNIESSADFICRHLSFKFGNVYFLSQILLRCVCGKSTKSASRTT